MVSLGLLALINQFHPFCSLPLIAVQGNRYSLHHGCRAALLDLAHDWLQLRIILKRTQLLLHVLPCVVAAHVLHHRLHVWI